MLQREHSAILLTFIKQPFVIKIFVLSNVEWSFYTCFNVRMCSFLVRPEPTIFGLSLTSYPYFICES